MAKRTIPGCKDVRELLSALTGVDITSGIADKPWEVADECFYVGTYETLDGDIKAMIRTDLPLSASLAALLTRFVPGTAQEAIAAKELVGDLFLNYFEVLNVMGGALNGENIDRVLFKNAFHKRDVPEKENKRLKQKPLERADYEISIPNYFGGQLSVFTYD